MTKRIKTLSRLAVTVFLALALCVSSFFNVRKAEAIAPAVPAAAAAVTALAAELGISEAALMAGVIGITAVGTGVYLLDSGNQTDFISQGEYDRLWTGDLGSGYPENWSDGYQNWRGPNGDTWGDLSPEEQSEYSSPADYVHSGLASLGVLFPDLFQVGNGGDLEPTPEPDPNTDPDGHEKWVKARNVLIALAAGTSGVALSDAVGILADNAAGSLKSLLFGNGATGMGLTYLDEYQINGIDVKFAYIDYTATKTSGSLTWNLTPNNWMFATYSTYYNYQPTLALKGGTTYGNTTPTITFSGTSTYTNQQSSSSGVSVVNGELISTASGRLGFNSSSDNLVGTFNLLNAAYAGIYNFPNDIAFQNGVMTGNYDSRSIDYGQLTDTPDSLAQSVLNNNNWNTYINNFTDAGNDETRTVTIPSFGDGSTHPQYYDFIDITPDSEVVPVPDDEVNPSPNPDPNPNPNPGTQYEQDFGERVTQLLAQPFNQLFPFCLIGDLEQLLNMLHEAAYGDGSGTDINGKSTLTIPLSDFNVEGADEIVLDFSVISSLGMFVRPLITALFVVGLLVGSYRFFLSRGGE